MPSFAVYVDHSDAVKAYNGVSKHLISLVHNGGSDVTWQGRNATTIPTAAHLLTFLPGNRAIASQHFLMVNHRSAMPTALCGILESPQGPKVRHCGGKARGSIVQRGWSPMQTCLSVIAKKKMVDDEKTVLSHVSAEDWMTLRLRDLYFRLRGSKFRRRMREDSCRSRCHLGAFDHVRLWDAVTVALSL